MRWHLLPTSSDNDLLHTTCDEEITLLGGKRGREGEREIEIERREKECEEERQEGIGRERWRERKRE